MKKIQSIFLISLMILCFAGCGINQTDDIVASEPITKSIFAMNTYITIDTYGKEAKQAAEDAEALLLDLEGIWSVTDQNSEIYQANHNDGLPISISSETEVLVQNALEIAGDTKGSFNPAMYPVSKAWGFTTSNYQIPEQELLDSLLANTDYQRVVVDNGMLQIPNDMELDLGAVAKGYAGDLVIQTIKNLGIESAILNLGGNVALVGQAPEGIPWKIGIRSPYGDGNIGILEAEDTHIITSGGYERYFTGEDGQTYWHILDPDNGKPADSGLISVTIVGQDGWRCDALSTALFVMGLEQAQQYWETQEGFEMILITADNEIFLTEGLEQQFQLNEASQMIPDHILRK